MCSEAPAFALLLVSTIFESLRSVAAMTQVRGQHSPGLSPPFMSFRLWPGTRQPVCSDGTLVHSFLACASDAGQSARSGSRATNQCFTSASQLGPPLRHLCCVMASGSAGLATGAAGNGPWRQLFLHAAPRPHSTGAHYKAWAAPSRGGNDPPSPLTTTCTSVRSGTPTPTRPHSHSTARHGTARHGTARHATNMHARARAPLHTDPELKRSPSAPSAHAHARRCSCEHRRTATPHT